ncbi:hypothetical protein [Leptothermofonsia sp. ETS-13]|uniref:hypothetical protein n=1 Tax=Leptothermofonsia sp. ETS-13 TaxID=3035696 RepID=UPI003BA09CD4
MSIGRTFLLLSVPLTLIAGSYFFHTAKATGSKPIETIKTFQRVEQTVRSGVSPAHYPHLVAEVNEAIAQLPADTPPRVIELLQGSSTAYALAFKYWKCDQQPTGSSQSECRDRKLEKVITQFPLIKRNITRRLELRTNPPTYLSSSITTINMLQLLLMQAELNRVDAHLILTGGKYDGVYSSQG